MTVEVPYHHFFPLIILSPTSIFSAATCFMILPPAIPFTLEISLEIIYSS